MNNRLDKNDYKDYLETYLSSTGRLKKKATPFTCLSPSHTDTHPSMYFWSRGNVCKCFSCGARMDIFDVIGVDYCTDSFYEQLKIADSLFGGV